MPEYKLDTFNMTHRAVHLGRILEQVASLDGSRGAALLGAADAVVRGVHGIEELRASLEGAERNDGEQHFKDATCHFGSP